MPSLPKMESTCSAETTLFRHNDPLYHLERYILGQRTVYQSSSQTLIKGQHCKQRFLKVGNLKPAMFTLFCILIVKLLDKMLDSVI